MPLSETQTHQVEAIASLVAQPNRSAVRQGVELAAALGDQAVFGELLAGLTPSTTKSSRYPNHRRYPTPARATRFESGTGNQAWLNLAMFHLLAASDLSVKSKVTSLSLGTPVRKLSDPAPALWLDGLEQLSGLTHLDLHLHKADSDLDLSVLARFANLRYLRIRGGSLPGAIPTMKHLQELNGVKIKFDSGAEFPALRSVRGQIYSTEPLTSEKMPNLVEVEARDSISLVGYESFERLWCTRGDVEVAGCRRVEHLRISASSFHAPDLRHVGLLDRVRGIDISQLETLRKVKLSRASMISRCVFPEGTELGDPKVVLSGPNLTDLGNIGELPGLEVLAMPRVTSRISLDTLRHAKDLRSLDIRHSTGITDLSPLVDLAKLEVVAIENPDRIEIPASLADRVVKQWRPYRLTEQLRKAKKQA